MTSEPTTKCEKCGGTVRLCSNGTRPCENHACIDFPYMTEQSREKWDAMLGRTFAAQLSQDAAPALAKVYELIECLYYEAYDSGLSGEARDANKAEKTKAALQRALAHLATDTARLNWLDAQREDVPGVDDYGAEILLAHAWGVYGQKSTVRAAIDAAMSDS